jgi:hypothetical protein
MKVLSETDSDDEDAYDALEVVSSGGCGGVNNGEDGTRGRAQTVAVKALQPMSTDHVRVPLRAKIAVLLAVLIAIFVFIFITLKITLLENVAANFPPMGVYQKFVTVGIQLAHSVRFAALLAVIVASLSALYSLHHLAKHCALLYRTEMRVQRARFVGRVKPNVVLHPAETAAGR